MTETRELRSVLSAAEQAANAGNYAAAEPLLREAAHLLETSLGASHPELANTLNNLAVVCELTGQIDEAEHFYRRAHAIASSTLKPDDELVITSERNLRDFCKARGRTFESPKVPPAPALPDVPTAPSASARSEPVPSAVSQPRAVREARAATPAPTPTFEPAIRQAGVDAPPPVVHPINVDPAPTARRPAPALVLGLTGAALAAFVAGLFWLRTPSPERTTTVTPTPTPT